MEDPGRGPTRGGSPEMEAIFIKIVIREKKFSFTNVDWKSGQF